MTRFLYDIFLWLYYYLALAASPFNPKAKKWINGRKNVWDELKQLKHGKRRVWVHCSSLGEYEQALPLIGKLIPSFEVVVTFFSPSGYETVRHKQPDALIFYLPHDSRSNAKRFLDIVAPELAVFVRYDLWYYFLTGIKERAIQTILISAVFREHDRFFQWYGGLFREMLGCFNWMFVQDEHSKNVLERHGFSNVTKTGDTRIDRVIAIRQAAKKFPVIERFAGSGKIFAVGSLEPMDESAILPFINSTRTDFKFIIAPHQVEKNEIRRLTEKINRQVALYSQSQTVDVSKSDVLIIDTIGMLSGIYRYAYLAYVGGGFGEGLHNVLEPAAWGVPVFFGPDYHKFLEAAALVSAGGAVIISSANELNAEVLKLTSLQNNYQTASESTLKWLQENKGGTEIIFDLIVKSGKTM